MAEADWPNADRRDEDKIYNPMTFAELKALAPQMPWDALFSKSGLPLNDQRQVIVAEKSAFPKLAVIFAETPVSVWRDYLTVHYLHTYAAYLPKAFDDEDFAFYGTVLQGNSQQLPRGARAAHLLDNTMGEALGKVYVAKYFPPEAKAKAVELVHNLLKAYEADIQTLDWMSPATKAKAEDKIHKFTIKIGYPDKWRDYSALVIKRDDLLGNIQRANAFEWNRQSEAHRPADRQDGMGHVATDCERLQQFAVERDRVSGRDHAAAVLRSQRRRRGELRRHRRRDRARDQPRFRRSGVEIRRRWQCSTTGGRPKT